MQQILIQNLVLQNRYFLTSPLQFVKYLLLLNKIQKNPPKNLPASHLLDLRSIEMRHKHHGVLANMMFALNGSLKCSERGMQMLAGRLSVQLWQYFTNCTTMHCRYMLQYYFHLFFPALRYKVYPTIPKSILLTEWH